MTVAAICIQMRAKQQYCHHNTCNSYIFLQNSSRRVTSYQKLINAQPSATDIKYVILKTQHMRIRQNQLDATGIDVYSH